MTRAFMLLTPLFFSSSSLAGWSTSVGEVTRVYSHDGAHVIRTTLTDAPCAVGAFWWSTTDADADDMFALALAALMSGKRIAVVYSDSAPNCQHGDSAEITHMRIDQ